MRVLVGVAEVGVDAFDQPWCRRMLESLGLGVHLVPRVVEHIGEEGLEQPVPPHHRDGDPHRARRSTRSGGLIRELRNGT